MRILCISYWAFAWSLIVLSNVLAVRILTESKSENSYFCLRANFTEDGHTRITFLRNAIEGSFSFLTYTSVWSLETRQLLTCAIDNNPVVAGKYLSRCAEQLETHVELSFNFSLLLNPDGPCERNPTVGLNYPISDPSRHRNNVEIKYRKKRAWVFPGTLWCGRGSKASGYDQLGMFERADHCCREHDHCRDTIHAFTVNYGVFNSNFFTVSHCECDHRFRQCLASVNDTISNMVGYSFFNILQVPCFQLTHRRRCVELNWWGMCKVAKVAPYAVFKKPSPFNITHIPDQQAASHKPPVAEGVTSSPNRKVWRGKLLKRPKMKGSSGRCVLTDSPRGDAFRLRRKKWKKCEKRNRKMPQTRVATTAQTRVASTAQTRVASTAQTRVASTAQTRVTTTAQTRVTTTAQTRVASTAQTRVASTAQTRVASTAQTRVTTTAQTRGTTTAQTRGTSTPQTRGTQTPKPSTQTRGDDNTLTTRGVASATRTKTDVAKRARKDKQKKGLKTQSKAVLSRSGQTGPQAATHTTRLTGSPQVATHTTRLTGSPMLTTALPLLKSTRRSTTTTTTAVSNTKSHRGTKGFRKRQRCRPRAPPRGDSFQPRRKACPEKQPTDQLSMYATTSPFTKSRAPTQAINPSPNTVSFPPRETSLSPGRKNNTETVPSTKTWTKPQIQTTSFPVGFREPLRTTNLFTSSSTEESLKPGRVRVS